MLQQGEEGGRQPGSVNDMILSHIGLASLLFASSVSCIFSIVSVMTTFPLERARVLRPELRG